MKQEHIVVGIDTNLDKLGRTASQQAPLSHIGVSFELQAVDTMIRALGDADSGAWTVVFSTVGDKHPNAWTTNSSHAARSIGSRVAIQVHSTRSRGS